MSREFHSKNRLWQRFQADRISLSRQVSILVVTSKIIDMRSGVMMRITHDLYNAFLIESSGAHD